jgi:hypothetical protein
MTRENYRLDYLNVEYNIIETEKKVNSIFDRVRVLNLEDVTFELKTILEYYDSLFNDFETEKLTRKYYEEGLVSFEKKNKHVNKVLRTVIEKLPEMKEQYNLNDEMLDLIKSLSGEFRSLNDDYEKLITLNKNHSFPFSKLNQELEIIILKLSKVEEKLNNLLQKVGNLKDDEGHIETYIGRSDKDRKVMAVKDSGKLAITNYKVITRFKEFCLVEFILETGRTHQIRVHAKHLGHPIVGDKTYGFKNQKFNLDGQLLHAYKLELTHPTTNDRKIFECVLPKYFKNILSKLR